MKYFLQSFSFTFLMYFGLWIMWVHFAIDIGLDAEYPGSLVYLPHAARVICTCIFTIQSIKMNYLITIGFH